MEKPGPICVWWKGTKWCCCGHQLTQATKKAWESHAKLRQYRLNNKNK